MIETIFCVIVALFILILLGASWYVSKLMRSFLNKNDELSSINDLLEFHKIALTNCLLAHLVIFVLIAIGLVLAISALGGFISWYIFLIATLVFPIIFYYGKTLPILEDLFFYIPTSNKDLLEARKEIAKLRKKDRVSQEADDNDT